MKPLSKEFSDALHTVFQRYNAYMSAFGPEEEYLRKKVEMELGTRMIHLKMRCSGLDSAWGKVYLIEASWLHFRFSVAYNFLDKQYIFNTRYISLSWQKAVYTRCNLNHL